jgi:hypothetical protein
LWVPLSAPGLGSGDQEAESGGVNRGGESRPVVQRDNTPSFLYTSEKCRLAPVNIPALPIEAARIEADAPEPRQTAGSDYNPCAWVDARISAATAALG